MFLYQTVLGYARMEEPWMKTALVTVRMATVDLTVKVSMLCGGSLH